MYNVQEIAGDRPAFHPHVLLVEDEFSIAKGLQMVMTEVGYDVDVADTGLAALNKFRAKQFDLLVADLRLPDIDGMEVVRSVMDSKPQTKVVIITGYPSVATAVKAVSMGVSDYLRKPFTDDEFITAVEGALKDKGKASLEHFLAATEQERIIQRQEVLRALDQASRDENFWQDLMDNGSSALQDYRMSRAAKAAIVSGDMNWLRANVGELSAAQLLFITKRLEREIW